MGYALTLDAIIDLREWRLTVELDFVCEYIASGCIPSRHEGVVSSDPLPTNIRVYLYTVGPSVIGCRRYRVVGQRQ